MDSPEREQWGRIGYEAYRECIQNQARVLRMPPWERLPPKMQEAWRCVAAAIRAAGGSA